MTYDVTLGGVFKIWIFAHQQLLCNTNKCRIVPNSSTNTFLNMAAVDFVTGYITDQVDGFVRPYVAQGAAMVGDFAGGLMYSVCPPPL